MKQLPELNKTKVLRARIHKDDYKKFSEEAVRQKMNNSEYLRSLIKKEIAEKAKYLFIFFILSLSACQYPHEDTLCRHLLRVASIYQGTKSTEQMLEESKTEMLNTCKSDNYRVEETLTDTQYIIFKYRCLNICNSKDEVENQPNPGNQ